MRIIISPAKKMNADTDCFDVLSLPVFLKEAEEIMSAQRSMHKQELKALWKCNAVIAARSFGQLWQMDLRKNLAPAILSFEEIQCRYMMPAAFADDQLDYLSAIKRHQCFFKHLNGHIHKSGSNDAGSGILAGNARVDDGNNPCLQHLDYVDPRGRACKVKKRYRIHFTLRKGDALHGFGEANCILTVPPTSCVTGKAAAMAKAPIPVVSVMALSPKSGFAPQP